MLDFIIFSVFGGGGARKAVNPQWWLRAEENIGSSVRERWGGLTNGGKCARAKSNSLDSSWFACPRREISPWRFTYSHLNCRRAGCSSKSSEDEGIAGSLHAERFTRVTANFNARLCFRFQFTCACQKPVIDPSEIAARLTNKRHTHFRLYYALLTE